MTAAKAVKEVAAYSNTYGKKDDFIKAMSLEHRTTQQSFTRLCLLWIEHVASDGYRYDGRNEASHKVCKTITESHKKISGYRASEMLPFI